MGWREPAGWTIRPFGYPITIRPTFFFVLLVLSGGQLSDYRRTAVWIAVASLSILWHELGHALAFRLYGFKSEIELWGMGGLTSPVAPYRADDRPGRDVVIYLAGPVAGLVLGGASYLLADAGVGASSLYAQIALRDAQWVNVGWTLVNLLPILPLDGGGVVSAVLRAIFRGRERAAAQCISVVAATGLAIYGFLSNWLWLILVGAWLAVQNLQSLTRPKSAPSAPSAPKGSLKAFQPWVQEALSAIADGQRKRALRAAQSKLGSDDRSTRCAAALITASVHVLEERDAEAAAIADQYLDDVLLTPVLAPDIVTAAGGEGRAVAMWTRAFERHPSQSMGGLLTQALIDAGRLDDATRLLFDRRLHPVAALTGRKVQIAFLQAERVADAADLGTRLLVDREGDPIIAYNVACSLARLDHQGEALEWLDRAVDWGFTQADLLDSDPDLETLREREPYDRIRQRLAG